jgi:hypothetical protein
MSTIVGTNIEVTNLKYDSDTTSMIISNTGQVTIQGEGTATTNLQQGLAKAWIDYKGTSTNAVMDSFNYSSPTDNGTGDYTMTFVSPPSSANYSIVDGTERLENNNSPGITGFETSSSTSYIHNHWHSGFGTADMFRTYSIMHGDLA